MKNQHFMPRTRWVSAARKGGSQKGGQARQRKVVGSGHVSKAAIIGLDGSVWAKTAGWNIEADAPAIANAMKQPADSLFGTGISFEKEKYFAIYSQDGTFYGKKGPNGLSLAKSTQCITVGWHQENINPANCRMTVEGIRDYLQSTGY